MITLQELLQKGISELKGVDNPGLEAKVILLNTFGISEEKLYSDPESEVSEKKKDLYFRKLEQRAKGMPLAYITGTKEFWSMEFKVGKGVLIPRPETEILVEKIIELDYGREGIIIDIGTGCGSVAVSAAKERPESMVLGIDVSYKAVCFAQENAAFHHIQNVWFVVGEIFAPLNKSVMKKECGFIVSNPPYVDEKEWHTLEPQIRNYEPKEALVSDQRGYEFVEKLIRQAPDYLRPGGYLIFEIGKGQEHRIMSFFTNSWEDVECHKDLAGIPRIFVARKTGKGGR